MPRNLLSTGEAAAAKQCSVQAIHAALSRGAIDGEQLGRFTFVKTTKKFQEWQPNPRRQKAGRESRKRPRPSR